MILNVHGPKLVPASKYKMLLEDILTLFTHTDRMVRRFDRENVRVFFPSHRINPHTVELQIFAGSSAAAQKSDMKAWQSSLITICETYWPRHIVNGFIDTLEVTSQFGNVKPKEPISAQ